MCEIVQNQQQGKSVDMAEIYTHTHTHTHLNPAKQNIKDINQTSKGN